MSTTLYPGIAFSPQTVLADNIGAADTIIPVADVSCFPDGPNLATIGTDETGETVFYAAKTADALSGCQRGVEGEARTWMAGEPVGRNFTAKDHNDLIDLLSQKQDKFEGKSGQVVGFNAEGKAVPQEPPVPPDAVTVPGGGEIEMEEGLGEGPYTFEFAPEEDGSAVQASQVGYDSTESGLEAETVQGALDKLSVSASRVSNPNLLDNAYWANRKSIINQREQEEYTGETYSLDRWKTQRNSLISLHEDYLHYSCSATANSGFWTTIEKERIPLNREITFSILMRGNGVIRVGQLGGEAVSLTDDWNVYTVTWNYSELEEYGDVSYYFGIWGIDIVEADIIAAKLELGSVQTLAHKEGDTWALNDPPPNKALELAKCQRYQLKFSGPAMCASNINGNSLDILLPVPVEMKKKPTCVDPKLQSIYLNGTNYSPDNFAFKQVNAGTTNSQYGIRFSAASVIDAMQAGTIGLFSCLLDANL